MINLLPSEYKTGVKSEYKRRFVIVVLVLVFAGFIVSTVISMPYAYSAFLVRSVVADKLEAIDANTQASSTKKILDEFDQLNQTLSLLNPKPSHLQKSYATLMSAVVSRKPASVKLIGFTASQTEKKGKVERVLFVTGVANSREDLLAFTKALSEDKMFSVVDLPVSNFSKKTDIEFSLTIKADVKDE